jgi:hypothetical protein
MELHSWKQRDIHEKRALNKAKLASFPKEEAQNSSLISRIDALHASTKSQGQSYIAHEILRLKSSLPYKYEEKKFSDKGVDEEGALPSEDHMIVSLLMQVVGGVQKKEAEAGKPPAADRTEALLSELEWHKGRLVERQEEIKKERSEIEKENAKYITSDDLQVGWDSKTVRCHFPFSPSNLLRTFLPPLSPFSLLTILYSTDRLLHAHRSAPTTEALFLQVRFEEDRNHHRDAQLACCRGGECEGC